MIYLLLVLTFAPVTPAQTASDCSQTNVLCVDIRTGPTREYPTIQAAVDAARPGGTVLVFTGTYAGFRVNRSGTASAPIVIRASGSVTINSASSTGDGIYLSNVSYIGIAGFAVQNVSGRCIAARDASPTAPMRGLSIVANTCTKAGNGGFYLSEVASSYVDGNRIFDVAGSHGIYLANAGSDNTILRRNTIYTIRGTDAAGIHMNGDLSVGGDGLITGAVIDGNTIYGVNFNAISMDGVQSATVQNNVIYNVARHGIRAFRIDGAQGPKSLRFINNSIHTATGSPIKTSEDLGGHIVFNNILLPGDSSSPGLAIGNPSNLRSDYNAVINRLSRDGGNSNLTLDQWRAYGYDAHSMVTTPPAVFVSPGSNYTLRAGAPVIDRGIAAFVSVPAPTIDRADKSRPQGAAHDMGAYEFSSTAAPDTTPPTVSITAPVSGSTVSGPAVVISAAASDNVGVAGVQFQVGGVNVGAEDTAAPYAATWDTTRQANGSYAVTAIARDAAGNRRTSAAVTVTVSNVSTLVPTTTTLTSSINPSKTGQAVTFTAMVAPATATGNVQFFDGSALLGATSLSAGRAVLSTSSFAAGTHSIKAVYTGMAGYAGSSSAVLAQVVQSVSSTDCANKNVLCVDDTPGTTQEYTTIQSAANAAIPGDTIIVHAGTYTGFRINTSGFSNAPITYTAIGAAITAPESSGAGIYLHRVSHVVIEGFTIQNVSQCIGAHDASATSPVSGLTIRNNTCTNASDGGFYLSEVSNSLVEGNTIYNIGGSHGIYLANGGSDNTTLRRNVIHTITGTDAAGIHMNGDLSIGGDGLITGAVLDGNTIYGVNFNAVSMDGVQSSTLQNNVVFGVARHAVRAFRIDGGQGPKNLRLINNSFHTPSNGGWALKITEDLGGHRVFNNILLTDNSSAGSICIGTTTGFASSNNAVVNRFSRNGENTIETLGQWQSSGFDTNSFVTTAAAVFVSPSAGDYRLGSGSPAVDKGIPSFNAVAAPAVDRTGNMRPRGAAYDVGAYEQ